MYMLIEAEAVFHWLNKMKQMENFDYLEHFHELVMVFEHLGGEPGMGTLEWMHNWWIQRVPWSTNNPVQGSR